MIIPNYTLNQDVAFFLADAACLLGQFTDCRTTEVGLANGDTEANPIGKWLISKLTITGLYALKVGAVPMTCAIVYGYDYKLGLALAAIGAGAGWAMGIRNYLSLRKAKISVF